MHKDNKILMFFGLFGVTALVVVALVGSLALWVGYRIYLNSRFSRDPGSISDVIPSRSLSATKAQSAIDIWMVQETRFNQSQGIQDLPQQNAARVDLQFSDFNINRDYNGGGTAMFSRYNDGRWVLDSITSNEGYGETWSGIGIEAR